MEDSKKTGLLGEVYASRFLRENGYNIVAANYRTGSGEIDIVALTGGIYVFVEVKSRSGKTLFAPSEAVDYGKQERVRSTAAAFVAAQRLDCDIRFDIIEVIFEGGGHTINHIKNAF